MHHYIQSEKLFKAWEKDYKTNKDMSIPVIQIIPPKDDVLEYASINDNW